MTTCKDINNLLPAYLEDALSPAERKHVEEHLAGCSSCRQAIADLKKAADLLHNLEEVEPPPFFEQRIMAAIREENKQRQSVWRKLFFPLHIKIPIQALATVFIAVFAFLVYQKSGPEIKQLSPLPPPVTKSAEKQVKPEIDRQPSVSSATQNREAPPASPQAQNRGQYAPPPLAGENKRDGLVASPTPLPEERPAATVLKDAEVMSKAEKSVAKGEAESMAMQAMLSSAKSRKSKMADAGSAAAPSPSRETQAVPMKRPGLNLTIQVPEMNQGKRDIEACLNRFNARILERKQRGETIFLQAQMDARHIAAFLQQMEDIGLVRTNNERLEFPAGNVAVDIRIYRLQ